MNNNYKIIIIILIFLIIYFFKNKENMSFELTNEQQAKLLELEKLERESNIKKQLKVYENNRSDIESQTNFNSIIKENNSHFPTGSVLPYNKSTAPAGWVICDGNNGKLINGIRIPDLRGKFLLGSGDKKNHEKNNSDVYVTDKTFPSHNHNIEFGKNNGRYGEYPDKNTIFTGFARAHQLWNSDRHFNPQSNSRIYNSPNDGPYMRQNSKIINVENTGNSNKWSPSFYSLVYIIKVGKILKNND